jgi:hypothetical protein
LKLSRLHYSHKTLQKQQVKNFSRSTKLNWQTPFYQRAQIPKKVKDSLKSDTVRAVYSLKRSKAKWLTPMLQFMEKLFSPKNTSAFTFTTSKTLMFKIKKWVWITNHFPTFYTPKRRKEKLQLNGTKNLSSLTWLQWSTLSQLPFKSIHS